MTEKTYADNLIENRIIAIKRVIQNGCAAIECNDCPLMDAHGAVNDAICTLLENASHGEKDE